MFSNKLMHYNMKRLVLAIILGSLAFSAYPQNEIYMKVSADQIIEGSKRCYQIKRGYARRDKTPWEPFCGEFTNFYYEPGYEYTMHVEKYDPQADTIRVIKAIARDNSAAYMKQLELRKKGSAQTQESSEE